MSALRQLGWVFLAWVLSESRGLVGPKSSRCSEKCLRPERSVECYSCAHPSCVCQVEGNVPVPEVGEEQVMVRVVVAGINPVETYIREGGTAFWINQQLFCSSRSIQQVTRAAVHTWHGCCRFCSSDWKKGVHHQGRLLSKWSPNTCHLLPCRLGTECLYLAIAASAITQALMPRSWVFLFYLLSELYQG